MINHLKSLNAQIVPLDELLYLSSQARALHAEYDLSAAEVPAWLSDAQNTLKIEIATRSREAILKRLRDLDAQEATLLTAGEKREKITAERERLKGQLTVS